jgi:hypothetical protein
MPACWKNESADLRRKICGLIDYFYAEAKEFNSDPWTHDNLLELSLLVKLSDIPKWRGCWLVTKEDKTVFEEATIHEDHASADSSDSDDDHGDDDLDGDGVVVVDSTSTEKKKQQATMDEYNCFVLKPRQLLNKIKYSPKTNNTSRYELLRHMENFTSIHHDHKSKKPLIPSAYLYVAQTEHQVSMANPTSEDVMISNLIAEMWGLKAPQNQAKRRLDYVH